MSSEACRYFRVSGFGANTPELALSLSLSLSLYIYIYITLYIYIYTPHALLSLPCGENFRALPIPSDTAREFGSRSSVQASGGCKKESCFEGIESGEKLALPWLHLLHCSTKDLPYPNNRKLSNP